ncbi:hypothetical protein A2U01_0083889, partial [Trifolium medium]|nr:hypothetical protein [Trifolium medium]
VIIGGPVLIVDNQGIGHRTAPLKETYSSWNAFNFGVTLFKN